MSSQILPHGCFGAFASSTADNFPYSPLRFSAEDQHHGYNDLFQAADVNSPGPLVLRYYSPDPSTPRSTLVAEEETSVEEKEERDIGTPQARFTFTPGSHPGASTSSSPIETIHPYGRPEDRSTFLRIMRERIRDSMSDSEDSSTSNDGALTNVSPRLKHRRIS